MEKFPLTIISPQGKIFSDQVTSVVVPGAHGSLGIWADHACMVTQLKKGIIKVKSKDVNKLYAVDSGVIEVTPQHEVIALVDHAVECPGTAEANEALQKFLTTPKQST